ncbi:MAG: hypothetical protein AAGJ97_00610, partial [Planctomycetota bacterium]
MSIVFVRTSLIVPVVFAAVGCSETDAIELGDVTGTVTIDGVPADEVRVTFVPVAGGRSSEATTDAEGRYLLYFSASKLGALVGEHRVAIAAIPDNNAQGDVSYPADAYAAARRQVTVEAG